VNGMDDNENTSALPVLPEQVGVLLERVETWALPPVGLENEILAALRREWDDDSSPVAGPFPALSPTTPVSNVGDDPRRSPGADAADDLASARARRTAGRGWSGTRWLGAAAAAVVVVAALAGGAVYLDTQNGPESVVALASTKLAPEASGQAEVRDTPSWYSIKLDVEGLHPAPAGSYYEAWLKNTEGDVVSIGTFHVHEGGRDIVLWSGIEPDAHPTISVTLQRIGAGPASSGKVVLRGTA
jgi:hypothetical protein